MKKKIVLAWTTLLLSFCALTAGGVEDPLSPIDLEGNTLLHQLAEQGQDEILSQTLQHLSDSDKFEQGLQIINKNGVGLLHACAKHGRASTARLLWELGAPTDQTDNDGRRPSHYACLWGDEETKQFVLEKSSLDDLEAIDNAGLTPAVIALINHGTPTLQQLINRGVSLDYATILTCQDIFSVLFPHVNPDGIDFEHEYALVPLAQTLDYQEGVELLINANAPLDEVHQLRESQERSNKRGNVGKLCKKFEEIRGIAVVDHQGNPPMHLGIAQGSDGNLILQKGCDPGQGHLVTNKTPVYVATESKNLQALTLLLSLKGCRPNEHTLIDNGSLEKLLGPTALMEAIVLNPDVDGTSNAIIAALLENPSVRHRLLKKDGFGSTALHHLVGHTFSNVSKEESDQLIQQRLETLLAAAPSKQDKKYLLTGTNKAGQNAHTIALLAGNAGAASILFEAGAPSQLLPEENPSLPLTFGARAKRKLLSFGNKNDGGESSAAGEARGPATSMTPGAPPQCFDENGEVSLVTSHIPGETLCLTSGSRDDSTNDESEG